jgi:hypothetical protein
MAANSDRVESFKETTNQLFVLFVVISAVSGALGVIVTVGASRREKQLRADYLSERRFYEERAQKYESQQLDLHSRVLRIYENQAQIGEKYGAHSDKIFSQQESYASGMAEITTTFKDILEDIKGISQFKVEESKLAIDALKKQAKAARILPRIQKELDELKRERDERLDDLLQDTAGLGRSRHEYTVPDHDLQALLFQFRIKFDGLSKLFLDKYSNQPQYGAVFYYRGLIAFLDGDILTAHKMFSISEQLAPFTKTGLDEMPHELRIRAAFTQFYLALLHKNYGKMRTAKEHVEKSYLMYGKDEESELLTLVTLAEVLSYLPEGLEASRNALKELFKRAEIRKAAQAFTNVEEQYLARARLIYGHTFYIESKWGEARAAYEKILEFDSKNYYAHYSLGQILQEEKRHQEAQATFDKAYQCLLDSGHLEIKPERNTQIALNALAYMCTRKIGQASAKQHLDAVSTHLAKVREVDGFELKLFSLKKKRLVTKDEFWSELLG